MRKTLVWAFVTSLALASAGQSQESPAHVLLTADGLTFGDGPPALPKGQLIAVLSGDPGKPGPFTLRAKVPAGYRIPPHWHPSDEHVTVLSGTVAFGMGDKFEDAGLKELTAGGFARMPASMRHYFTARTAAVIQVHGTGPFAITYVDPADDPRSAASSK
jgi:quercetin dioxygenase-like cupin family protein